MHRGKSFKNHPSYRITYHAGTKKHGFQAEIARFRHKKSICDDLQWYADMMRVHFTRFLFPGGRCGNMFLKRRQNVVDASSMRRRCVVDASSTWRVHRDW